MVILPRLRSLGSPTLLERVMFDRKNDRLQVCATISPDLPADPAAVQIAADKCHNLRAGVTVLARAVLGARPAAVILDRGYYFRLPFAVVEACLPEGGARIQLDGFVHLR